MGLASQGKDSHEFITLDQLVCWRLSTELNGLRVFPPDLAQVPVGVLFVSLTGAAGTRDEGKA